MSGTKPPATVARSWLVEETSWALPNAMTTIKTKMRKMTSLPNVHSALRKLT
jgi:hypothetical protein